MAGIRGYHNYRGRTSKAKMALTVFLILVILAAVAVILLQRHVVYDETGTPKLELPWMNGSRGQEETEQPNIMDLTIESGESDGQRGKAIRAFLLPAAVLNRAGWESVCSEMERADSAYDAVAVTLKSGAGTVYFDAEAAQADVVKAEADTAEVLADITDGENPAYAIARISCFHDPQAANSNVEEMGLQNTGGYIFYDGKNSQWIDPAKPAARAYLCNLAREAAELGFDEILLTDVGYPTEGKLDKIAYGDAGKGESLQKFLEEIRGILEPYQVMLSIEVSKEAFLERADNASGLTLRSAAGSADRIYAEVSPETAEQCAAAVMEINPAAEFVPMFREDVGYADGSHVIIR